MAHIKQFEHLKISLDTINSATNNFADENCIGSGGFGKVYKAEVDHSKGKTMVALKRLDRRYGQGDPEFWKEIMMLSFYKHENIVSLLGYCDDCNEKILVYEYIPKRSLELYLDSSELTWVRRLQICIGAAHGLAYLHSANETKQRVLHRDIKSSNILLDEEWHARISDFGLSKFGPANEKYTFLFSQAVGTFGYCDPLYVETGLLTKESDVYSFGVVLFEVLCGRLCMDKNNKHPFLVGLARQSYKQNTIAEIIYDDIKDQIDPDSLKVFTKIAYQCLNRDREERPLMTDILKELENALRRQEHIKDQLENMNLLPKPNEVLESSRANKREIDIRYVNYKASVVDVEILINAAFRSSLEDEVYLFMKNECACINYAPGTLDDRVIYGPGPICDSFPSLSGTAFEKYGIDCAFTTHYGNECFIFSGNLCAKIDYAPGSRNDKILKGPMSIFEMFSFLKGTVFKTGVDAAFESSIKDEAYLFKGNQYARINYSDRLILFQDIGDGFRSLKGTMFEKGFDAAFASHRLNEAYLFKGDNYAIINFAPASTNDYIITGPKKIFPYWPSLKSLLSRPNDTITP